MKNNILIIIFLISQLMFSQQITKNNFVYENIICKGSNVELLEKYNSSTGNYTFIYLGNDGTRRNINFIVWLTNKEKEKLFALKKKLEINISSICIEIKNENLISSSSFFYCQDYNQCAKNEEEKGKIISLQSSFFEIMESKPEYKRSLYWKFRKM